MTALRLATAAMGTRFEVVILPAGEATIQERAAGEAAIQERAAGEAAIQERAAGEAAIQEIEEWHRRLSRFAADSLLSHINRTAASERVRLDRETFELLTDALDVWHASGGAFDITVAPAPGTPGLAGSPAADRRIVGRAINLRADDWTIGFEDPGVSLDLGGVAKGHALDCAGAVLRAHGVTAALLHGGTSSVLAIGAPPGTDGWRVAVGAVAGAPVLSLRDEALSVSDSQGQAALGMPAHILDPRTGAAIHGTGRVAVRGPSARLADAWSTALVVLGLVPDTFPPGYEALLTTVTA